MQNVQQSKRSLANLSGYAANCFGHTQHQHNTNTTPTLHTHKATYWFRFAAQNKTKNKIK